MCRSRRVADAFHDFAVEWGPGRIVWEFDGVPFLEATPDDVAPDAWVFDQPFFLLLNVAVGGNFGGPVADATTFPQRMVVDHVRVHGAADTAERFEARFVDDVDGWQRIELPFGAFARSDDQPVGAPDTGLQLAETWGYEVLAPGPTGFRLDDVWTLGPATVAPDIEVGLDPPAPDGDDGWYTSPVEVSLVADDGASVAWRTAGTSDWTVWEPPVVVDTDGTHVLEYRATPVVGVHPSEVGDVAFRLDTTPPRTTASLAGEEQGGAFVEEVTVTLDATDATSGVAETQMQVDGGATTTVTGPVTFDTVGEHLVSYRSRDVAGNLEGWRTVGVEVVDADPPTGPGLPPPDDPPAGPGGPDDPPAGPGTPPVLVCEDHPGGSRFPDAPGSGHARTIECLGALGIVEGMADGRFRPADDVSRAQLASFVVRALERASGTTMDPGTARFPDVAITSTHGQAVHKLRAADVVRGHPDGTFRPAEPVTREQTARYVVNAIERQTGRQLPTSGVGFPDVASGSQYARDIDKLVTSGVVSGFGDGTFGPREPVTRGQMTRFVANMLDVLAPTP